MLPMSLDQYQVLTSMLAPALLMAATGSLLISANARLARVVDRLRAVMAEWQDADEAQRAELEAEIRSQRTRSGFNLRACLMLYLALAAFVATSIALAIDAFTNFALGPLPTITALVGTGCLLMASIYLALEVRMAIRGLDAEISMQMRQRPSGPKPGARA
ncbi:DUF2721 domain-containing protein [Alkalisalibacterium limincola]|uniref:DUF2721 domain-containing protein n=1 Tax=Alkalisalibacterium limincola TaxID=2699169 RepID=A0A5C8KYS4_9GAMM|nr:DUF2721 domain-containing protein [Alkalisalibacterium limincola]TXK64507.1 DUF2721 domain-containing protein [Alkalisalibacterium limincola]